MDSRRRPRSSIPARTLLTEGLVLRRVDFGEADLICWMFTETLGRVHVLARGARRARASTSASLEPLHTYRLRIEERPGQELLVLRETHMSSPRQGYFESIDAMTFAGRYLGWLRDALPPHCPEPQLWRDANALLDTLAEPTLPHAEARLGLAGLALLAELGWGLQFESCVRCGRPCEPGRAALVSPQDGGLVCRDCGGGPHLLTGPQRDALLAARSSPQAALVELPGALLCTLVDDALRSHTQGRSA